MSVKALFQPLRSRAASDISSSYAVVGTEIDVPFRIFRINNATQGNLLLSTDGTTDMIFIQAGAAVIYDVSTNKQLEPVFAFPAKTQFYVKQVSAPTSGSVYIEVIYGIGT